MSYSRKFLMPSPDRQARHAGRQSAHVIFRAFDDHRARGIAELKFLDAEIDGFFRVDRARTSSRGSRP